MSREIDNLIDRAMKNPGTAGIGNGADTRRILGLDPVQVNLGTTRTSAHFGRTARNNSEASFSLGA